MSLYKIKRTPLADLTVAQHFEISLAGFMSDLRIEANKCRSRGHFEYMRPHLLYLQGRIHGLYYGLSSLLIFGCPHSDFERAEALFTAARNEAAFLVSDYQWGQS